VRLSVLDQSPIAEGSTAAEALCNTLDLARLADDLGYHRYWVAEHHGGPMLAGAAPEVLIAEIAGATRRLRVGSGGVMLPHYSPFKVAEVFSILSALHPGRIDLGIGRASGTDPLTTFALQRDRRQASPDDFPQQLVELLAHLDDTLPGDHPFKRLGAFLPGPERPEPWLLGSSPQSAIWAGQLGLPYAFADFINRDGAQIAARYRDRFAEQGHEHAPRTAVAGWVLCAESEQEAQRLAASSRMTMRLLRRGQLIPVPPPEKALEFLAREDAARFAREDATRFAGREDATRFAGREDAARFAGREDAARFAGREDATRVPGRAGAGAAGRRAIIGAPEQVRAGIEQLAEEYGAEEVIVVTITYDHAARRRSYELIADAFAPASEASYQAA
jgi:luciferase family oxidoreductase group 1